MSSFFFGLLGGFIAWLMGTVAGQPLYHFLSLRSEAARVLALYERPAADENLIPYDDGVLSRAKNNDAWRAERARAYQTCGSQFLALAASNSLLNAALHHFKLNPSNAGEAMLGLAELPRHSGASQLLQHNVIAALKLKLSPQF